MKLLFDQNLSPKLCLKLNTIFSEAFHVSNYSLGLASDLSIWDYAKKNQLTLVTKDSDFHDLSVLLGFPPKVIWIKSGNISTEEIVELFFNKVEKIKDFYLNDHAGYLILQTAPLKIT